MAWEFTLAFANDLFALTYVDAAPQDEHTFMLDGRRDPVPGTNLVRRHNVMGVAAGELKIEVPLCAPVYLRYDDLPFDPETGQMGNANPFGHERGVFPDGEWMKLTPGDEGATWLCFMPVEGKRLNYEVFKGPHVFRVPNTRTFATVTKGCAYITAHGECLRWESFELSPETQSIVNTHNSDDEFVTYYVWEDV